MRLKPRRLLRQAMPPRSPATRTQYTLTLRPLPSAMPEAIRMRKLLKTALRIYRFECQSIQRDQPNAQNQIPATAKPEERES